MMTMKKSVKGAMFATAVASFVLNGCATADNGSTTVAKATKVKCAGIHSCAGNSDCAGNGNAKCKGHNKCAPYGWKYTSSEAECKEKGGKVFQG